MREAISSRLIKSAHDVTDGGLAIAIAESCISSGLGAKCYIPICDDRIDKMLFGEGGSRVLISIASNKLEDFKIALRSMNEQMSFDIPAKFLGMVSKEDKLIIYRNKYKIVDLSIKDISQTFNESISKRIESSTL